jgi:hypothetical protein
LLRQHPATIYQGRGELTVKQHTSALRTAKVQRVPVPEQFHDVQIFEPETRTYVLEDVPTQPGVRMQTTNYSGRLVDREVLAETLAAMAQLLAVSAERLRHPGTGNKGTHLDAG